MLIISDNPQNTELNLLLQRQLRIDFISIKLIQDSVEIEGNGYVSQNENNELIITFFRKMPLNEMGKFNMMFNEEEIGGIQKKKCDILAIDNNGYEYSASTIYVSNCDNIVEINISELKSSPKSNISRAIFLGKYEIPTNSSYSTISSYRPFCEEIICDDNSKSTTISNSFSQRSIARQDMWTINLNDNLKLYLCQFKNYAELLISSKNRLTQDIFDNIIQTFEFVLSENMQMAYYSIKDNCCCYLSVDRLFSSAKVMSPPFIKSNEPKYKDEQTKLFKSYFHFISNTEPTKKIALIKSHRLIIASSRLYSYNFGLTLSIEIESLINVFYNDYPLILLDDPKFKEEVQLVIKYAKSDALKHLGAKKWINNRLNSGLSKEKRNNSKILEQLIKDKKVLGEFKNWDKLRNSLAHGSGGEDHEKLLLNIFGCLEIYYTLIYSIIQHSGFYSNHHTDKNITDSYYKLPEDNPIE